MFKKTLLLIIILFIFFVSTVDAQKVKQRYWDSIYSTVVIKSDIKYGESIDINGNLKPLLLDFYSPLFTDKVTLRPLIIFIHGGGFQSNDKMGNISNSWLTKFSKRGYACASINYRLGIASSKSDTAYFEALYRAVQDGKAVIRFLRKNAEEFRIDTSKIFVMGTSAGAMTALHIAYLDENEVPSFINKNKLSTLNGDNINNGYSSKIHGLINCWGALWDLRWMQEGDIPIYNIHGLEDKIIPYDSSNNYHGFKYGSYSIYQRAIKLGIYTGWRPFYNSGHTLDNDVLKQDSAFLDICKWLYILVDNKKLNYGINKNHFYIDANNGNDSNNGISSETAWKSLEKINNTIFRPGDKILFKTGCIWKGKLNPKGSGSKDNPIVIDKYGQGFKPLILGDSTPGDGVFYLYNQEYWEINNLEITSDAQTGADRRGVQVSASNYGIVNHIYLKNLTIHNIKGIIGNSIEAKRTGGIGIETIDDRKIDTRFNDILIENCEIYCVDNTGIFTDNRIDVSDYPESQQWNKRKFTNVKIRSNIIHDIAKNAMIIRLLENGVIEYNLCFNTAFRAGTGNTIFSRSCNGTIFQYNEGYLNRTKDFDGCLYDADLQSPNTIWQYSFSHDNNHGLMWFCTTEKDTGIIVRYNVSQNDKGRLLAFRYNLGTAYIYNNIFYIEKGLSPEIIHEKPKSKHTYYYFNNIIFNNSNTSKYSWGESKRNIDYNLFFGKHPDTEPLDPHKTTLDPKFINPGISGFKLTNLDGYRLKENSPCINSGIKLFNHCRKDFWGNSVPDESGVIDRGIYEYSPQNLQDKLN